MKFQLQSPFYTSFAFRKLAKKTRTNPAPLALFVTR